MSDNLRRYRAIRHALAQCYPTASQGNFTRHLNTLAALISGIVGSKSTQLPHIATKVPDGTQPESRVKRFARRCDNAHILEEVYFLPLRILAASSRFGDGGARHGWQRRGPRVDRADDPCRLKRSRPATGLAGAPRSEGTLSGSSPHRRGRVDARGDPEGAKVVFLGDGEFDGTGVAGHAA